MPNVLVVDDSAVDRRLVGGLIEKDPELSVTFAANGTHALTMMRQNVPALVLTDLIMPEMNGLELVKAIREHHPFVPVILMTSKGNEEIAVQALQGGAASYVPKSQLAGTLLDTIGRVLDASRPREGQARLLQHVVQNRCTFQLENDCTLFPPLINFVQEHATRFGLFDQTERVRLGIALEEALVNALYHGNLEVQSALMEKSHEAYYAMVEERAQQSPYKQRKIHVEVCVSTDEVTVRIRDDGPGFEPASLPDPTDPVNLDKVSGRGLLLMRTFVDELNFNDRGNEVTLVKRRRAVESDALACSEEL
ncbi:MAG TPA: response regulator [Pirellulales bacterium]|jgi:CheY-like chemotaxis protein/anti-sigma regulatory factor (Ser/Thr protein kinase)